MPYEGVNLKYFILVQASKVPNGSGVHGMKWQEYIENGIILRSAANKQSKDNIRDLEYWDLIMEILGGVEKNLRIR